MIRVEALNHDGEWDLLGVFENWAKKQIDACIAENDDYFLRKVRTGHRRRVFWMNFEEGDLV